MARGTLDRKTLEDLWHQRLKNANLRLDFARNYVNEVKRDLLSPDIPAADGNFRVSTGDPV